MGLEVTSSPRAAAAPAVHTDSPRSTFTDVDLMAPATPAVPSRHAHNPLHAPQVPLQFERDPGCLPGARPVGEGGFNICGPRCIQVGPGCYLGVCVPCIELSNRGIGICGCCPQ